MLNKTGTGALKGPLATIARNFKSELRASLSFEGWGIHEELHLEQACQGFLRSQRAVAYELNRPFDGTANMATQEATAGTTLTNAALEKIKAAREAYQPRVTETLKAIQESPAELPDPPENAPISHLEARRDPQFEEVDHQEVNHDVSPAAEEPVNEDYDEDEEEEIEDPPLPASHGLFGRIRRDL